MLAKNTSRHFSKGKQIANKHERIRNITGDENNINQSNNDILLCTYYNGKYFKKQQRKKLTNIGEDVEK